MTGLLAIVSTFLGLGVGLALSGGLLGPTENDIVTTAQAMSVAFVGAGLLNGAIGRLEDRTRFSFPTGHRNITRAAPVTDAHAAADEEPR